MKLIKGVGALALSFVMLTATEAAGLAIKGVSPQLKQAVAKLSDNRRVILARTPFATFATPNTPQLVMSFVFRGQSLEPGDMVAVDVWGSGNNNSAGTQAMVVQADAIQGATTFNLAAAICGGLAAVGPNTLFGWHASFMFSVGVPNAQGVYVPNTSASAVTRGSTYSSGLQPSSSINFTGNGQLLATDTTLAGAVVYGGRIQAGAGLSSLTGRVQPYVFDSSQPIEIDVSISITGSPTTLSVNAGVMEGL